MKNHIIKDYIGRKIANILKTNLIELSEDTKVNYTMETCAIVYMIISGSYISQIFGCSSNFSKKRESLKGNEILFLFSVFKMLLFYRDCAIIIN